MTDTTTEAALLDAAALLAHWKGHRVLTRRTIEAFPEDRLFSFRPALPMRSFGEMMTEVTGMVEPTLRGLAVGEWTATLGYRDVTTKDDLLSAWNATSALIQDLWPRIRPGRFLEVEGAFGMAAQPLVNFVLYLLDNEVHHRAQGFVYLRLLGIEPPPFYERLTNPSVQS